MKGIMAMIFNRKGFLLHAEKFYELKKIIFEPFRRETLKMFFLVISKVLCYHNRIKAGNQWRNKWGRQPGYWPRAQTKKLKKSHTKGRKKFFFKVATFFTGAQKS